MEFVSEYIANYQNVWWHYVLIWIISFLASVSIAGFILGDVGVKDVHSPFAIACCISMVFATINCIFFVLLFNQT